MSRKGFVLSIARAALFAAGLLAGIVTESAAGQLSGRVTSSTTTNGLAGTVVRFFNLDQDDGQDDFTTATVDSLGFYTVNLEPGTYAVLTDNNQGYINEIWDNIPCSSVCDTNAIIPIPVGTDPITNINFVLDPGGRIEGTVTDATLNPLANVVVTFIDPDGQVDFTSATTDATGYYISRGGTATGNVFAVTSNSQGYRNEVYDNIYCLDCNPGNPPEDGTPIAVTIGVTRSGINFALDAGGRISGNVTNGSTPLANVTVSVYDSTGARVDEINTDASGNFSSAGLPGGTYYAGTSNSGLVDELWNNITCPGGNCNPTSGTVITVTSSPPTTTGGINFALAAGGTITGTVTAAVGGALIENAQVSIYTSGGSFITNTYTNSSGVYSILMPAGNYFATANNVAGFANQLYNNKPCPGFCTVTGGDVIPVTAGATTGSINFALQAGGNITGRVTNASTTAGVSGLGVQLYSNSGSFLQSTGTDASGNYTLSGIAAGSYFVRTNSNSNLINQLYNGITCISCNVSTSGGTLVPVSSGSTTSNINFALQPGGRISGTVTNAASPFAPIQNVSAQIYNSTGGFLASFTTDASGNYITQGLPAGNYFVRTSNSLGFIDELYDNITCIGCSVTSSGGTLVPVTVGATTPGINFALAAGGRISGTVTNAASPFAPIQNVNVQIYNAAGSFLGSANTNASGFYNTSGLPAGNYFVRTSNSLGFADELYDNITCIGCSVTSSGGTLVPVTVGTTTPGINFALAAGGRISGTVTRVATGAGLSGVSVQIYNSSGTFLGSVNTDSSGNYTTSALPAATYFARTSNSIGLANRLYNNKPCSAGCDVTAGTGIVVTAPNTTTGVNFALNSVFAYSDNPLVQQVTVATTQHITELRTHINTLRSQVSLGAFTFTEALIAGTTPIRALHIRELRTALDAVYDALVMTRPTYTDPVLTEGTTPLKAAHISELRNAVEAVR